MNKEILRKLRYDVNKVLEFYPGLAVTYRNGIPTALYGNFRIADKEGILQGDYDIRVLIPTDYPKGFPSLIETSKKIERIDDRHISKDGNCCVEITQKILLLRNRGITLLEFFKKYVYKFFCWQLVYDEEGRTDLEQWGHRDIGTKQFYFDLLRCKDNSIVRKFIRAILDNKVPGRKDPCLCGSGMSSKKCHKSIFYELEQIGNVQLMQDLKIF